MASEGAGSGRVESAPVGVKAGWGVAGILATAQFIMVLDTTVMNVSITQVVDDLDTTFKRPGGTGGDWLPSLVDTRNEGVRGSSQRVGFPRFAGLSSELTTP